MTTWVLFNPCPCHSVCSHTPSFVWQHEAGVVEQYSESEEAVSSALPHLPTSPSTRQWPSAQLWHPAGIHTHKHTHMHARAYVVGAACWSASLSCRCVRWRHTPTVPSHRSRWTPKRSWWCSLLSHDPSLPWPLPTLPNSFLMPLFFS